MSDFARRIVSGEKIAPAILALAVVAAILVVACLIFAMRLRGLQKRLQALTRNMEGQNLEEMLVSHLGVVAEAVRRMETLEQAVGVLQAQMPACLQRANLIRYDAFDDVGGEQSFSLAILDANGDGLVLSSVYSRMDVRVYAKAIRKGHASHALSIEEERALSG